MQMQRAEPRCTRRSAPLPMASGDSAADGSDAGGAFPAPCRERDQMPSVPPRVLLDELQFEEEGESPMGDAPTVTYSPPNTRRAQSAGGSSSTSVGDIPALLPPQPPPSAAAAAAAAAGEDCGECLNCKDKPKFGGPGTKRKGCLIRREIKLLRPSGQAVSVVVGTPPVASVLANKSPKRDSLSTGGSVESILVGQTPDADEAGLAPVPLSAPSADPNDDCATSVPGLDEPKVGAREMKRKGGLRKQEATDATESIAHPVHDADVEDDAPASCSTDKARAAACETPATVDALAGPPNSGAASEDPRAYEQRLRLRAEARGAGKRAASGLSVCSTYSAGAASSSAAKSDGDDSEAEEAPDREYEAGTDGTPDAGPGEDYAAVHVIGEGLNETEESGSPRAPLNELSANRDVPGTPQLKTPDLEVAAGGVSPLSELANILEVTPNLRLPEQARPARLEREATRRKYPLAVTCE